MDFKKCNRCGSFYVANGDVCPKCNSKENQDISTFKNYLEENGCEGSIYEMASQTGISAKHINRFLSYEEFKNYTNSENKLNQSSTSQVGKVTLENNKTNLD